MLDIRETKIQGWKEKYQLEIFMLQLSNSNKKKSHSRQWWKDI